MLPLWQSRAELETQTFPCMDRSRQVDIIRVHGGLVDPPLPQSLILQFTIIIVPTLQSVPFNVCQCSVDFGNVTISSDNRTNTIIIICFVRLSPECSFVLETRGEHFIEDCQVKLKTVQWLLKGPDFGTLSRSGPMSKKSPEKGPICLSSPEVY